MKQLLIVPCIVAMAVLMFAPVQVVAATDTLTVYSTTDLLDTIVRKDTLANGTQAHHVYKLVSTDTTYILNSTITINGTVTFLGVPKAGTGKLPTIQPNVLQDNSIPGILFAFTGKGSTVQFRNLYLIGIAPNNKTNTAAGQGIQVTADSLKLVVDNCVMEQLAQFCIGYSGNWDKFFITNSKFRNLTSVPSQYYVSELLRNQNYNGSFKTDSILIKYNTMLAIGCYMTAATGGKVNYYEFSHNNLVHSFKNPFFLDRIVNAKFNNNIFYNAFAGGQTKAEFGGWDSFTNNNGPAIITMGPLDSTTAALLLGHQRATPADSVTAEGLRKVEVKNNAYFWPAAMLNFIANNWNDTAHVDSMYTTTWMNAQSTAMFTNKTVWPGFVQSGNQNVDPGFGASIPNVLNPGTANANGVGLIGFWVAVRGGLGTTETYGYSLTQIPQPEPANWTPAWPLPEANDMKYSNVSLKTAATDGSVLGDPNWWGISLAVAPPSGATPQTYALSQNYPNPFNPATKIDFSIPSSSQVQLKVYNVLGQEVATLVNETLTTGSHTVTFDASKYSSGVYMYKITAGSFVSTRKMVLLK
jgi:hypothetical protein